MKPFNLDAVKAGKPVCTRQGHEVRICGFSKKEIIGFIILHCGDEISSVWDNNGYQNGIYNDNALMMKTDKKEGWVNVYRCDNGTRIYSMNSTKNHADCSATEDRVACIKIEWEE